MNKKGFTLVELLAVIVILAIIALIAIPLIGNVIEKAKIGALESSVNGLVESANMYYANNTIKGETVTETTFDFEDGEQVSTQKLQYKGKVYNGKLILHANGEVAVCIDDEEHYAYKNKDTDEIVSGNGTCLYDGTTGNFSSNSSITDLRGKNIVATDIFQSADGLSTLIKIPEEGHYDENSIISVPNSQLNDTPFKVEIIETATTTTGSSSTIEKTINVGQMAIVVTDNSQLTTSNDDAITHINGTCNIISGQSTLGNDSNLYIIKPTEETGSISFSKTAGGSTWGSYAYVLLDISDVEDFTIKKTYNSTTTQSMPVQIVNVGEMLIIGNDNSTPTISEGYTPFLSLYSTANIITGQTSGENDSRLTIIIPDDTTGPVAISGVFGGSTWTSSEYALLSL